MIVFYAAVGRPDDRMVMAAPSIVLLLCAVIAVVAVTALAYVQYRHSEKVEPSAERSPSPEETI